MTTLERIDELTNERSRLYRLALDSAKGDVEVKRRISEISDELNELWDLRRRERVGKLEGIDLLVEQSYARIYGENFETAVAPVTVEDEHTVAVAA